MPRGLSWRENEGSRATRLRLTGAREQSSAVRVLQLRIAICTLAFRSKPELRMPSTSSDVAALRKELTVFQQEVDQCALFFYAGSTVQWISARNRAVLRALNETPTLWNTISDALQASTFLALGRIFDKDRDSHSVHRLLNLAEACSPAFSKAALEARKRAESSNADEWIDGYMRDAYVPVARDFSRLRSHVARYDALYRDRVQPVRHKAYAHRDRNKDLALLFQNARIRDVRRILDFLRKLYQALFDLFHNGRKPVLAPVRSSVRRALTRKTQLAGFPGMVIKQTEALLRQLATAPWSPTDT